MTKPGVARFRGGPQDNISTTQIDIGGVTVIHRKRMGKYMVLGSFSTRDSVLGYLRSNGGTCVKIIGIRTSQNIGDLPNEVTPTTVEAFAQFIRDHKFAISPESSKQLSKLVRRTMLLQHTEETTAARCL